MTSPYYVYDNKAQKRSKVHRASCRHCNSGKGKTGVEVGPGDLWVAASTLKEAEEKAQAIGRARWDHCRVCLPKGGAKLVGATGISR